MPGSSDAQKSGSDATTCADAQTIYFFIVWASAQVVASLPDF